MAHKESGKIGTSFLNTYIKVGSITIQHSSSTQLGGCKLDTSFLSTSVKSSSLSLSHSSGMNLKSQKAMAGKVFVTR